MVDLDVPQSRHSRETLDRVRPRDQARFRFQQNWFELVRKDWERLTRPIRKDRQLQVLEIGSFEGASTTWMLDHLLDHPESTMVAVDTFQGGMEHQVEDQPGEPAQAAPSTNKSDVETSNHVAADGVDYQLQSLQERFLGNVKQCKNFHKLRVIKALSQDALVMLLTERAAFDFIYIDGSHVAQDVLHDAVLSWRLLHVGGTLVFDDFSWKGYMEDLYNPRIAIEAFLKCVENEADSQETESQMWLTKVPNKIKPTSNPDASLYYWDRPRWQMVSQPI